MDAKETIKALLEASEDGTITAEQVTQAGLHRSVLQELVKSGELYRFGRGLYVRSGIWEDELYLLQRKYGRGIYSMETALYLHGYSDRTPAQYTMTFPKGYNTPSLKQENVTIKWVQQLNYPLGIIEIPSPCGNPIRVYDLERTLCDLLRGSGGDIQIINPAMKRYVVSKDRDIHKLLQYAQQLRVQPLPLLCPRCPWQSTQRVLLQNHSCVRSFQKYRGLGVSQKDKSPLISMEKSGDL